MKFVRIEHNPETFEYLVDGKSMAFESHDSVGWGGLAALSQMFERIAKIHGEKVEKVFNEEG